MNKIIFEVNNQSLLSFEQAAIDKKVSVYNTSNSGKEFLRDISCGDFVMLFNLYDYIKRNDIQNDFINPNGKNKE